jgi:hypothetical protein
MVLNSDHWCFGKDSYKAIPTFKEAVEFRRINKIGKKKKIAGINDVDTKEKNVGKKNMMGKKKRKKQGTRGRKLQMFAEGTNFYVNFSDFELEEFSAMNMYLGCTHFCADGGQYEPIPLNRLDIILSYNV